jgi:hypothetical protein
VSDQPGGEPPIFDLTPGTDVIGTPPPASRRPLVLVLGTVAVVVALLLAGAGVKRFVGTASHAGGAAAAWVPASTFAYVQIDMNPSAEQKLALFNFSRKFPDSPTTRPGATADNLRDTLLSAMIDDPDVDYAKDVKPWLGDDMALAAFSDAAGHARAVLAMGVKDRDAAAVGLKRLASKDKAKDQNDVYAVEDGYALFAPDQASLDNARAQLAKGSLQSNDTFEHDAATLPSDQLVLGWVDVGKGLRPTERLVADKGCAVLSQMMPGHQACSVETLDKLARAGSNHLDTTRLVLGGRVASNYVDVQLRVRGGAAGHGSDVAGMVGSLPDDTSFALGVGSVASQLRENERLISTMPDLILPDAQGQSASDAWATAKRQIREATGLRYPDDFATVLGDRAVFAMHVRPGFEQRGGVPDIGVRSTPKDLAAARRLAERFVDRAAPDAPMGVRTAGRDLVVAMGNGYAARLAEGGHLGDKALFRTAMGSLDHANVAMYMDVRAFGVSDKDAPITAVGLVMRYDGADTVAELRVVAADMPVE